MIDEAILNRALAEALEEGGDLAEIYIEDRTSTSMEIEDRQIRNVRVGRDAGAGIRVVRNGVTGYAYTEELSEGALCDAARAARKLAGAPAPKGPVGTAASTIPSGWFGSYELEEGERKRELLLRADEAARSAGDGIVQVRGNFADSLRRVLIVNSRGESRRDERRLARLSVTATARRGNVLRVGMESRGGQDRLDSIDPVFIGRRAGEAAIRMLDARPAPAGVMPVVIACGWGGVLVHEACGHCLEGDFVARGLSPYAGKVGEVVANPLVTVIDDGTIPGAAGSLTVDDEGTPAQKTTLIDRGVLAGYMFDRGYAQKMGVASTGSARRESFRHPPMVRMRNTYIAPGTTKPEEIIAGTKRGLYVAFMGGGQADLGKGDFLFSATEAYLIEDGKITSPVAGATLIGNGFDALKSVDAVGNDWAIAIGTCGKIQSATVTVGQPMIRIPALQVGGTAIS